MGIDHTAIAVADLDLSVPFYSGKLGFELTAIVRIKPSPGQLPRIPELAEQIPEIAECHRITGEDCFLIKVHLHSVTHLEEVIDQFTPYGQTTTSIVQSSPVPLRGLAPEPVPQPLPERV